MQSNEFTPEQVATMPASIPAAGSKGGSTAPSNDEKKNDTKEGSSQKTDVIAAKNEPTKKMYCN